MNAITRITRHDALFIAASLFVLVGCISSSYRSAKTMQPGQVSFGAGYVHSVALEENDPAMQFLSLDSRVGVVRGVDLGLMYSKDLSTEKDGEFSTIWGDVKLQLTNRDNEVGKPIATLGIVKGYIPTDDDDPVHITGFPLMFGLPISPSSTLTLSYQMDLFSENAFPEGDAWDNPRHTVTLGSEFEVMARKPGQWMPKVGMGVGYLFGESWAQMLNLSFGISVDSPL